jgi:hypothetical protein
LLAKLLDCSGPGRKPAQAQDWDEQVRSARRRVLRVGPSGLAAKTASVFQAVLADVNAAHDLGAAPMGLRDVLGAWAGEGQSLLRAGEVAHATEVLAQAASSISSTAGQANKRAIVGLIASARHPDDAKPLSTRQVSLVTGMSLSHVRKSRAAITAGDHGATFGLDRPRGCSRRRITPLEKVNRRSAQPTSALSQASVKTWMREACPARSGDTRATYWMTKDQADFYNEDYRSVEAQVFIFEHALAVCSLLIASSIRILTKLHYFILPQTHPAILAAVSQQQQPPQALQQPQSSWLRNLSTYLGNYSCTDRGPTNWT